MSDEATARTHTENIAATYDKWKDVVGGKPVDVVAASLADANIVFNDVKVKRDSSPVLMNKFRIGRDYLFAVFKGQAFVDNEKEKAAASKYSLGPVTAALDQDLRARTLCRAVNCMWFVLAMDAVQAIGMGIGNTGGALRDKFMKIKNLDWNTVFAIGGQRDKAATGTWLDYVGQFRSMWQADKDPFPESDVKKLPANIQAWLNGELPSIEAAVGMNLAAEAAAAK